MKTHALEMVHIYGMNKANVNKRNRSKYSKIKLINLA